ncbi:chaperonin cpn60-like 2 [Quercus suber]|uniref:Chaperonin cpn60-like 2 n=1 Tax=Quercus suber TaxID=58331 RepID=A0AAW0LP16_QUESU
MTSYFCIMKGFLKVITEDRGLTLDKVQFEMLGTAKKVSVSLDDTIILQGGGDKKLIEERCAEAPAFTIASNTGFDGALVIGKLLEHGMVDLEAV